MSAHDTQKNGIEYKIENVVATADFKTEINLVRMARKLVEAEYNPERFPGLIFRIKEPRATFLVFTTGKTVITGVKNPEFTEEVMSKLSETLRDTGIKIEESEYTVQNIVASGDLENRVDLNMAAIAMEYAMYEPEVFPGLIYRMQKPKCVFLIFAGGKVICVGSKSKENLDAAMTNILEDVEKAGVIIEPGGAEKNEFKKLSFI